VRLLKTEIFHQENFMTGDVNILKIPFAEIEEITKQKIGFPNWDFLGSFEKKYLSIFLCECLCLLELIFQFILLLRKISMFSF
jgi:hypothetical protein